MYFFEEEGALRCLLHLDFETRLNELEQQAEKERQESESRPARKIGLEGRPFLKAVLSRVDCWDVRAFGKNASFLF